MSHDPIFVVGPPRTGTTLTARILGGHSAIFMMPIEFMFFQRIYEPRVALGASAAGADAPAAVVEALRRLAYRKRRERVYWQMLDRLFADEAVVARLGSAPSYRQLLSEFMDALVRQSGKRRWGNQVPADVFALDDILELFPDARIVLCMRHPLDFLVSYRNMWQRAERKNKPQKARRDKAYYHPVLTSVLWRVCAGLGREALARWPERVFVNRYEDLVGDAEQQARRLCGFLGESFEPAMLQIDRENSSRVVREKGIFKSSVGQWRGALSAEEVALCQAVCRGGMRRFGYEAVPSEARALLLLRDLSRTPLAAWRALAASSEFSGRLLPYSVRRTMFRWQRPHDLPA